MPQLNPLTVVRDGATLKPASRAYMGANLVWPRVDIKLVGPGTDVTAEAQPMMPSDIGANFTAYLRMIGTWLYALGYRPTGDQTVPWAITQFITYNGYWYGWTGATWTYYSGSKDSLAVSRTDVGFGFQYMTTAQTLACLTARFSSTSGVNQWFGAYGLVDTKLVTWNGSAWSVPGGLAPFSSDKVLMPYSFVPVGSAFLPIHRVVEPGWSDDATLVANLTALGYTSIFPTLTLCGTTVLDPGHNWRSVRWDPASGTWLNGLAALINVAPGATVVNAALAALPAADRLIAMNWIYTVSATYTTGQSATIAGLQVYRTGRTFAPWQTGTAP